jgi:hypothetical protein
MPGVGGLVRQGVEFWIARVAHRKDKEGTMTGSFLRSNYRYCVREMKSGPNQIFHRKEIFNFWKLVMTNMFTRFVNTPQDATQSFSSP